MFTILSTNIGVPKDILWDNKTINTSMLRSPTQKIFVFKDRVIGDDFHNPQFHGLDHSRIYAFGLNSISLYYKQLNLPFEYSAGFLGENLTVDILDETSISVGDVFQVGSVILQATYPRIPCVKLNYQMQNPQGQKAMFECGRSGVYFRVLQEGTIQKGDSLSKVSSSKNPYFISDIFNNTFKKSWTMDDLQKIYMNGTFPQIMIDKIKVLI